MDTALFISASSHARELGPCLERDSKSQHALSWVGEGCNQPPESQNWYGENLGGMLEFAHSSPTSIQRDTEDDYRAHF
jgi:hypothetical protein